MFFTYQVAANGQQITFAWKITLCFCKISWRCQRIYWLIVHFLYSYWFKDLFEWILSEDLVSKGVLCQKTEYSSKNKKYFAVFFFPHKIQSKFRDRNAFTNQKVNDLIDLDTSRFWVNSPKSLVFFFLTVEPILIFR